MRMSVYVDNAVHQSGPMLMAHMVADTAEELNEMAGKIGLASSCRLADRYPCYNISDDKRAEAITHGAIEVDTRKIVDVLNAMRPKGDAVSDKRSLADILDGDIAEAVRQVEFNTFALSTAVKQGNYSEAAMRQELILRYKARLRGLRFYREHV